MTWRLFLALLMCAAGAAGAAAATPQAELRALLDAQVRAWNRGDLEGFMQAYHRSDATAFAGASGVSRGWQALLDRYRRNYPDRAAMGTLAFSDLGITMLSPKAALVLGRWRLTREKDSPGGVFTLVARKFREGWRIIHDHTSTTTPAR